MLQGTFPAAAPASEMQVDRSECRTCVWNWGGVAEVYRPNKNVCKYFLSTIVWKNAGRFEQSGPRVDGGDVRED
jgi:hypothetical protein